MAKGTRKTPRTSARRTPIEWDPILGKQGDAIAWKDLPSGYQELHFFFPKYLKGGPRYEVLDASNPKIEREVDLAMEEPQCEGVEESCFEYTVIAEPGHILVSDKLGGPRPRILVSPVFIPPDGGREPGPGGKPGRPRR